MTGAMYSAVAGLRSHMSKLNVIGNNIANVNTFSYKSTRMTFEESISMTLRAGSNSAGTTTGGVNPSQFGYGANVSSIDMNMATSTYSPTGYAMDCMINGDGFFLTGDKLGTFQTASDIASLALSRMGDFGLSDDGYVRDSRGEVVYGFAYVQNPEYDPMATDDQIKENPLLAQETILSTDLVPLRLPLAAAAPTEENGGYAILDVPVYGDDGEQEEDENGDPVSIQVEKYYWKAGDAVYNVLSAADPENGNAMYNNSVLPTWDSEMEYYDDEGNLIEDQVGGMTYSTFVGYPTGTDTTAIVANEDDFPVQLSSISINENGMISGINSVTGDPVTIGYIAIATVDNSAGVTNTGSCYYSAQGGSGNIRVSILGGIADGMYLANKTPSFVYDVDEDGNQLETGSYQNLGIATLDSIGAGGNTSVVSGGLEASNVDLAVEFTEMITTQRGYQANTRVVTVTDSMLEELVNLKR